MAPASASSITCPVRNPARQWRAGAPDSTSAPGAHVNGNLIWADPLRDAIRTWARPSARAFQHPEYLVSKKRKRDRRSSADVAALLMFAAASGGTSGRTAHAPASLAPAARPVPRSYPRAPPTATTSNSTLTINQTTDRAVLNWSSFNVSADGRVVFQQPRSSSIALNRIFQNDPSRILGSVQANGEIYLVNPNGFVFGQTARVNASGILASTLASPIRCSTPDCFRLSSSSRKTPALQSDGRVGVLNADGTPRLGPDGQPIRIQLAVEEGARFTTSGTGRPHPACWPERHQWRHAGGGRRTGDPRCG